MKQCVLLSVCVLGLSLCVPHSCPCGEQVGAQGLHVTVCKKAPGRIARHQVLNDIICRSMGSAGIPATIPKNLLDWSGKTVNGPTDSHVNPVARRKIIGLGRNCGQYLGSILR